MVSEVKPYRHTPTARGEPCPWTYTLPPEEQHDDPHWRACYAWEPCEKRCRRHQRALQDRQRERRREADHPRNFPFPKRPHRSGQCNWCGDPITTVRAKSRAWHDGRDGEPDCLYAYFLHTRPEMQRAFLLRRDGLGCCDCGATEGRWLCWWTMRGEWRRHEDHERQYPRDVWVGDADVISWSTSLQLEHDVPLWKVAHLPDDERATYFGPENLRLRCAACHAAKTRREAAERAATKRPKVFSEVEIVQDVGQI